MRATRIGETFIELEWSPPKLDGGCPITHYIVHLSQFSPDDWKQVALLSSCNTHLCVVELIEDMKYYFSVRAENKIGVSEPTQTDKPITTMKGLRKYLSFGLFRNSIIFTFIFYPSFVFLLLCSSRIKLSTSNYSFIKILP